MVVMVVVTNNPPLTQWWRWEWQCWWRWWVVEVVKVVKVVVGFCSHDLTLCLDLLAVHECGATIS